MATAPDGLLPSLLGHIFGRSWRTQLAGFVALVCGVLPLIPGIPPQVAEVCRVLAPLAIGGGFIVAKDAKVSGLPTSKDPQ